MEIQTVCGFYLCVDRCQTCIACCTLLYLAPTGNLEQVPLSCAGSQNQTNIVQTQA